MQQLSETITITVSGSNSDGRATLIYLLADFLDHTGIQIDADLSIDDLNTVTDNFEIMLETVCTTTQVKLIDL